MKQDLNEIFRCLETLHLTDPALRKERIAETETLEMFACEIIPALRGTQENSRRFYPVTTSAPNSFMYEVEGRSQNKIPRNKLKETRAR